MIITDFCTVLSLIFFMTITVLIGWILSKSMQAQNLRTNTVIIITTSLLVSLALFAKHGLSMPAIQGIFLLFVLLFASSSDMTTHTVTDAVWIIISALSLLTIAERGVVSMLIGAFCVFFPQIAMALIPPHKTFGGADIKISTALAFLLGAWRGIGAYIIGLAMAVLVMYFYNKHTERCKNEPFALVPFLSIGAMIMFLV